MTTLASPQWLGLLTDIIAITGIFVAAYQAYKGRQEAKRDREDRQQEERRKNTQISLTLSEKDGKRKIYLPNKIRRSVLTRSEVLGRMGMIPRIPNPAASYQKQDRFQIKYTTTADFNESIDTLFVTEGSELSISCESDEIEQFDREAMEPLGFDMRGF